MKVLCNSFYFAVVVSLLAGCQEMHQVEKFVNAGNKTSTVETRLGKLELVNGYPSKETAEKLYDDIDFQRACVLHTWALPAVGFHALHVAQLNVFGARDGDIVLYQDLNDKGGMLTPNLTTTYAMSFWNLQKQGALVIEVPEGATAGGVADIWQRPITDTGQTGPDKGQGGKYLILAPDAPDVKAEGYIIKRSPTVQVWFGSRGLDPNRDAAEQTLRKHRLYAWDQRDHEPQQTFIPVGGRGWKSQQPDDLFYWRYLHEVIEPETPEARDRFFYAMLIPLGLEKGKAFQPDERQQRILTEAAKVGEIMARTIAYDKRFPTATVWAGRHWELANLVELNQEAKDYAQLDQRASWFYEAIGNTAGMQGRTVGFGQVYLEVSKDGDDKWLDGANQYHLNVPANAPAKQFWSITLYDNTTRGIVVTDQGAAELSSRKKLDVNADGSTDLYFGPTKPQKANNNWIKTQPGKGWFAYFRLYAPTESYFNKSWQLPDIELVK